MSQKKKRIIAYGLSLLCILTLLVTSVGKGKGISFALTDRQEFLIGENVKAVWNGNTLTLTGEGDTYDYSPDSSPFSSLQGVAEQVVIENGVTGIGSYLFYDFENLSGELVIPSTVISIGDGAFSGTEKASAPHFTSIRNQFVEQTVVYSQEIVETEEINESLAQKQAFFGQMEWYTLNQDIPEVVNDIGMDETEIVQESETVENSEPTQESETIENNEPTQESETVENSEPTQESETIENNEPTQESETVENSEPTQESESTENIEPTQESETVENSEPTQESESTENSESTQESESTENSESTQEKETSESTLTEEESRATEQISITYTEQILGKQIFYPGQVGAYEVSESTNHSFISAVCEAGYAGYLGTREVTITDWDDNEKVVTLINTEQGLVLPELEALGYVLPQQEDIVYTFLGYKGESGTIYEESSYAGEYAFSLEFDIEYLKLVEQTLQVWIDEYTSVSVTGEFPVEAELFVKSPLRVGDNLIPSADDETLTEIHLQEAEMLSKDSLRSWRFSMAVMVSGKLYIPPKSPQKITCSIAMQMIEEEEEICLYQIKGEGIVPVEENVSENSTGEDSQSLTTLFYPDGWGSYLCVERSLVTHPKQVEMTVMARGIVLELPEVSEEQLLEEIPEDCLLVSQRIQEEVSQNESSGDQDQEDIRSIHYYQTQVSYGEDCELPYVLSEEYERPVSVSIYESQSLLGQFICEDIDIISITKDYIEQDICLVISATPEALEPVPVMVSVADEAIYLPLEHGSSMSAAIGGVWDIHGATVRFDLERAIEEKDLNCMVEGAFTQEDLALVLDQGKLPAGTRVVLLAEKAGAEMMYSYKTSGETDRIALQDFRNFEENFSAENISALQFIFEFRECSSLPGNATYSIHIEDNLALGDNQVEISFRQFVKQSAEAYVSSGGENGKSCEVLEGGTVAFSVHKTESSAYEGRYLVVGLYGDSDCVEAVSFPKQVSVSPGAEVCGNLLIMPNSSQSVEEITIEGLSGYEGLGQNVSVYLKAYMMEKNPGEFLGNPLYLAQSDVVEVKLLPYATYGLSIDNHMMTIHAGDSLPGFSIDYTVNGQAAGYDYRILSKLEKSSIGSESGFETIKTELLSKPLGFTTGDGKSAGSFTGVKAYIPTDLTEGTYRLVLQLVDQENRMKIQDMIYILVEE